MVKTKLTITILSLALVLILIPQITLADLPVEPDCSQIQSCTGYTSSADCLANSCNLTGAAGATAGACKWSGTSCSLDTNQHATTCSQIQSCSQYSNQTDCLANSCGITGTNGATAGACKWNGALCGINTNQQATTCQQIQNCSQYTNQNDCQANTCNITGTNGTTSGACKWNGTLCGINTQATQSPAPSNSGLPGIDLTIQDVFAIINGLACWLMRVVVFVMIIYLVWAGLRYMQAGGNPAAIALANKNLKYAIIGIVVIMGVYVIIATVANAVGVQFSFIPLVC